MDETRASLTCQRRGCTSDCLLTDAHLVVKSRKGSRSGETRLLLKDLSPSPARSTGRARMVWQRLTTGCVFLVAGCILFFSSVQSHVPLLSPHPTLAES